MIPAREAYDSLILQSYSSRHKIMLLRQPTGRWWQLVRASRPTSKRLSTCISPHDSQNHSRFAESVKTTKRQRACSGRTSRIASWRASNQRFSMRLSRVLSGRCLVPVGESQMPQRVAFSELAPFFPRFHLAARRKRRFWEGVSALEEHIAELRGVCAGLPDRRKGPLAERA